MIGLNFDNDDSFKKRDNFLKINSSDAFIEVFEMLKDDTLFVEEQILLYQVFLDSIFEEKIKLSNLHMPLLDLERILNNMVKFIKENFNVPEIIDDDDDLDPFVSEVLSSLQQCLARSVTEPQDKFLVPLERTITKIKDWNKHAVSHLIIPIKDLEFLMISWRKSSHQWLKIESRIHNHLEQGM